MDEGYFVFTSLVDNAHFFAYIFAVTYHDRDGVSVEYLSVYLFARTGFIPDTRTLLESFRPSLRRTAQSIANRLGM